MSMRNNHQPMGECRHNRLHQTSPQHTCFVRELEIAKGVDIQGNQAYSVGEHFVLHDGRVVLKVYSLDRKARNLHK